MTDQQAEVKTTPVETKPDAARQAAVTNPAPVGAVPSPVEVNNRLAMVLQDIERLNERVHGLLDIHADVVELHDLLKKARLFVADKIGLIENKDGNLIPKV